jgi:GTPase SAR1 family protein
MERGCQVMHPTLVGGAGSGKSSRVIQLAKNLNKTVRIVILSQLLPEDIGGIPKLQEDITKYTLPDWVESEIVFFDELDKVLNQPHKLSPILSILSERKLHGKELNNIFIFGAQVSNDIRFLEYLNENEETSDALSRRLLIIPCPYKEAIEFLKNKGMKRIKLDGSEIDKKLMNFKLNSFLPPHYEYIYEFTREYTKMLPDYMFKNKEERDQYVKQVLEELFYYLNPEGVLSAIEDALDSGDETRTEQEEQLYHYEIVKNFKKYAIPQVYHSLATIQNKITAREFYTAFLYCYVNSSIDERSKFFRELYESVKEKEEFTNSTDIVVIFWHIVASLCYLKRKNELPFDFEELPEVFKKKILEMEKEVFEE